MRQVNRNPELTTLQLPKLETVGYYGGYLKYSYLDVRARALARARLIAPAAARIAPSLPCC